MEEAAPEGADRGQKQKGKNMNRGQNGRGNAEENVSIDLVFKALSDPHRIQILKLLKERERNGGEILESVNIVQSTLSHHMKSLTEAGLVTARRSGKWTYYSLCPEAAVRARDFLLEFTEGTESSAAEPEEEAAPVRKAAPVKEAAPAKEAALAKKAAPAAEPVSDKSAPAAGETVPEKTAPLTGSDLAERTSPEAEAEKDSKKKKKDKKSKKGKKNGKK